MAEARQVDCSISSFKRADRGDRDERRRKRRKATTVISPDGGNELARKGETYISFKEAAHVHFLEMLGIWSKKRSYREDAGSWAGRPSTGSIKNSTPFLIVFIFPFLPFVIMNHAIDIHRQRDDDVRQGIRAGR